MDECSRNHLHKLSQRPFWMVTPVCRVCGQGSFLVFFSYVMCMNLLMHMFVYAYVFYC